MHSYEILVDGPIGPVVTSVLTGFTTIAAAAGTTVLIGTAADARHLIAIFTVLDAHGYSLMDVEITLVDPDQRPGPGLPFAGSPDRRTVPRPQAAVSVTADQWPPNAGNRPEAPQRRLQ